MIERFFANLLCLQDMKKKLEREELEAFRKDMVNEVKSVAPVSDRSYYLAQGGEKYEELRELIKHVEEEQEREIEASVRSVNIAACFWQNNRTRKRNQEGRVRRRQNHARR